MTTTGISFAQRFENYFPNLLQICNFELRLLDTPDAIDRMNQTVHALLDEDMPPSPFLLGLRELIESSSITNSCYTDDFLEDAPRLLHTMLVDAFSAEPKDDNKSQFVWREGNEKRFTGNLWAWASRFGIQYSEESGCEAYQLVTLATETGLLQQDNEEYLGIAAGNFFLPAIYEAGLRRYKLNLSAMLKRESDAAEVK